MNIKTISASERHQRVATGGDSKPALFSVLVKLFAGTLGGGFFAYQLYSLRHVIGLVVGILFAAAIAYALVVTTKRR
jgi:hypothetical protein